MSAGVTAAGPRPRGAADTSGHRCCVYDNATRKRPTLRLSQEYLFISGAASGGKQTTQNVKRRVELWCMKCFRDAAGCRVELTMCLSETCPSSFIQLRHKSLWESHEETLNQHKTFLESFFCYVLHNSNWRLCLCKLTDSAVVVTHLVWQDCQQK